MSNSVSTKIHALVHTGRQQALSRLTEATRDLRIKLQEHQVDARVVQRRVSDGIIWQIFVPERTEEVVERVKSLAKPTRGVLKIQVLADTEHATKEAIYQRIRAANLEVSLPLRYSEGRRYYVNDGRDRVEDLVMSEFALTMQANI